MRINLRDELLPLNILVILLILVITFFPSSAWRIVLGLPFILFFPGYTLIATLFPRKTALDNIKRVALSFGLSIVVVSLIGLILDYTPWGIRVEPILYSVASFIFITSIIGWVRRHRLPPSECFSTDFQLKVPGWSGNAWDKTLSVILIIAILAALGTSAYVIAKPKVGEKFTEFYILGQDNGAKYPKEVVVGEEGEVSIGIINHEYEIVSYRVEVRINGVKNNGVEGITLEHDKKWEKIVSFTPDRVGDSQKVEFLLYKNGEGEPCFQPLYLLVNVKGEK